jgi:hypothetical protein
LNLVWLLGLRVVARSEKTPAGRRRYQDRF